MIRAAAFICLAAVVATSGAGAFPLGFSIGGGTGLGYYSMSALNEHIGIVAQESLLSVDELANGVNVRLEGRLWYARIAAITGGYEHFWGKTESVESSSLSYQAPADVYTLGILVTFLRFENSFDLGVGANYCRAEAFYRTNETTIRRLAEFTGEDGGFETYAEIHTNFLNPLEIGFQLGYRRLKIETLNDAYGDRAYFEPDLPIEIDYSGVFFYLTSSIRIN